jgi:hypothetical protein
MQHRSAPDNTGAITWRDEHKRPCRSRRATHREPTTLRLTDAGRSLIRSHDVGVWRPPGGAGVRHGAARCGQNCGHTVVRGGLRDDQGGSHLTPRSKQLFLEDQSVPQLCFTRCCWCSVVVCVVVTAVVSSSPGLGLALLPRHRDRRRLRRAGAANTCAENRDGRARVDPRWRRPRGAPGVRLQGASCVRSP